MPAKPPLQEPRREALAKRFKNPQDPLKVVAHISFDGLPSIDTNQRDPRDASKDTGPTKEALNPINADPPTIAVAALPAKVDGSFQVQWSGEDIGTGIAAYDICVSTNGGPWTLWQSSVTGTNALFPGQSGHTYRFYSVARDYAGNSESKLPTTDAETHVRANTAPVLAAFADQVINENTTLVIANGATDADIPPPYREEEREIAVRFKGPSVQRPELSLRESRDMLGP
ncbi:MAG: hypothetical protein AAB676_21000 [Verrucomicrobiota bacterium]